MIKNDNKEHFSDEDDEEIFRLAMKYNPPLDLPDSTEKRVMAGYREHMKMKVASKGFFFNFKRSIHSWFSKPDFFKYSVVALASVVMLFVVPLSWYILSQNNHPIEVGSLHTPTATPISIISPDPNQYRSGSNPNNLKEIKNIYIKLGEDNWSKELKSEIQAPFKTLKWNITDNSISAGAAFRVDLEKGKAFIINDREKILWEMPIDKTISPRDVAKNIQEQLAKELIK